MGAKPTTIGGGKSTGVANDFASQLQQWLSQGFGSVPGAQQTAGDNLGRSNPGGQVSNLTQAFQALFSGGNGLANSVQQVADIRRKENVGDIRSRYALGGTGYGTPAASGEARFLAEFDPAVAGQVGSIQMDGITKALSLLMPLFQQQVDKGTPQAQTVMKPSGFTDAISTIGQVAGIAAPFVMPGLGGAASFAGGGIPKAPAMGNLQQQASAAPRFDVNSIMAPSPNLQWDPRYLSGIPSFAGSYRG